MKVKLRKILSIFILLCLVLTALPSQSFAAVEVCEIEGTPYTTLDDALAAVSAGQTATIKLLDDITYNNGIEISGGQTITFDLDGYTLNVVTSSGIALYVTSGHAGYTGPGAFNVTGATCGVSANGNEASVSVSSATATSDGGNGAVAMNGGSVTVNGNVQGGYNGVSVANAGSTAVINGNATGTASDSSGARAGSGGSVTINSGTAQGVMYGAYSNGSEGVTDSSITINGGDAIGTGTYSHGVHAEIYGNVSVDGNVQGTQYGVYSSDGTSVVVTGNVTVTAGVNGYGVDAEHEGTIEIGGNVVANGSSLGAYATSGGRVTIDGSILASNYIRIFDNINEVPVYMDGSADSRTVPTTKEDYYTYSAGTSTVWVKVPTADTTPPVWTSGYPGTAYVSYEDIGLLVSANENCTVYYVVLTSGATAPSSDQVQSGQDAGGNALPYPGSDNFDYTSPPNGESHGVLGLTQGTDYDIYVVLKDSSGNLQNIPARVDVRTRSHIDTVPNDENSGISGQVRGTDGSKKVTLTITVRNAAGEAITGIGPEYFEVSVDGGPVQRFDLSSLFSGCTHTGSGAYTVIFTGDAHNKEYSFTNLTADGVVIETGPTTVTTPPAEDDNNGSTGSGGGNGSPAKPTYSADIKAGSGANTTLPVSVDSDTGKAAVNVSSQNNLMSGGEVSVISIPSIPNVVTYTLGIPVQYLSTLDQEGSLILSTNAGSITIPSNMLSSAARATGAQAEITIGKGDNSNLSDAVKAAIGDRPLIQLTLTLGGKQTDWYNPSAPVTVSIPYTPTAEELANSESITVWYIDGSGNAVSVPNGHYDPATGTVTFTTAHFSDYAVVYSQVGYRDVAESAWYYKAVSFIAAREITTGTGDDSFSPKANLTRGQFIVMLMKAYGIEPDKNPSDNFSDAGNTYYTDYLAAAKYLGISAGTGGNLFEPKKEITRQEMFTLLYNTLAVINSLPQGSSGSTLSDFTDAGQIESWARDAIALLVETGTVEGNGGKLAPEAKTTRAEMAQVLYSLLSE